MGNTKSTKLGKKSTFTDYRIVQIKRLTKPYRSIIVLTMQAVPFIQARPQNGDFMENQGKRVGTNFAALRSNGACRSKRAIRGFSLVEILVVLAISAVLIGIGLPVLSVFRAGEMNDAVYTVSDVLAQARTYAMSMNTYVYVGLVQDTNSPSGSVVIAAIASSDGTQIFSASNAVPGQNSISLSPNSASFKLISKLVHIDNIQAVALPASSSTNGSPRPLVPDGDKLGDPTFAETAMSCSFAVGNYTFTSMPGATGVAGVTSEGMLQISPLGVTSQVGGTPAPFFEVGLQPARGNTSNYAAIQIAGLSGSVRIYRP